MYTFMDIETTGFSRTEDDIISYAYILTSEDFKEIIGTGVRYLYRDGQAESSPGAFGVHGITTKFLKQFEAEYENNLCKLHKVTSNVRLIGHNIDSFDAPFIDAYLYKNGITEHRIRGESIDTMRAYQSVYGKRMKLTALCEDMGITPEIIVASQKQLFPNQSVINRAHDASYDTVATLLVVLRGRKDGVL